MPKLTKTTIDRIKPSPKDELHWCSETRGFGVRMTPTGKLSFIVQGRVAGVPGAAPARITIGPYGVFTVGQARNVAHEHLRSMRLGLDPRAARKAEAALKVTLQQVCDAYVSRPGRLKESSKTEIKRHIEKVFAAWKDRPIVAIGEDDVRKRHREIMEHGLRGKKGAPASANAAMVKLDPHRGIPRLLKDGPDQYSETVEPHGSLVDAAIERAYRRGFTQGA